MYTTFYSSLDGHFPYLDIVNNTAITSVCKYLISPGQGLGRGGMKEGVKKEDLSEPKDLRFTYLEGVHKLLHRQKNRCGCFCPRVTLPQTPGNDKS